MLPAAPIDKPVRAASWRGRLARVLRDDVQAKGMVGTLQTVVRMLRLLVRWPAHRRWLRIVGGPTTRGILAVYPRIAYLHSFSYLFAGSTWPQRLAMASAHYAFVNRMHDAAFFERAIAPGGVDLWHDDRAGHRMSIALLGPCLVSRHHEGDWTLAFAMDDRTLCKIAFSVIGAQAVPQLATTSADVIYIGQVQGTAGTHEATREAARLMHAIAPRDLLMNALAGAAEGWGIDTLLGVPSARLLSVEAWFNSSSHFDYDRFWRDHGSRPTAQGHHAMPLPFAEKPLAAIAARHRGRTLVKRHFKQAVSAAVAEAVRAHRKPRS